MSTDAKKYKVIGTRPIRHDGADKVTGRAIYTADLQLTGLVHGRILRSPHAHARIKNVDISAAKALLDQHPNPTEQQIRFELAGNLCRCTGYDKIIRAVQDAAKKLSPKA